jgi:SMI1-KNR4 cell-wall
LSTESTFHDLCREGLSSGPAAPEIVSQAESDLGVVFPGAYREFLMAFGSLVGRGFEIYGLPPQHNEASRTWQSVVEVNKRLRKMHQAGTDKPGFIAVSDDGMGVYFYLDTNAAPETPIWAIGPGVEKRIAASIGDFFNNFAEHASRI